MQLVRAALTNQTRSPPPSTGPVPPPSTGPVPPPLVLAALQILLNDPDHLISTITVSHPVSSLEEGEAIGNAVGRVAFEHQIAVELSLSSSHVRIRLYRLTRQREAPDGED